MYELIDLWTFFRSKIITKLNYSTFTQTLKVVKFDTSIE